MANTAAATVQHVLDSVYRNDSRRVLATLIRLLGDLDRAEEALQEAFAAASRRWPEEGVPRNPTAWLVSAGRFRAIDAMRRNTRFDNALPDLLRDTGTYDDPGDLATEAVKDDQLRLIFMCCHPALSPDARLALTLREVCDLTTEEIARRQLIAQATVAQRIVRAKARIRSAGIPYEVPTEDELPSRLESVLHVVYVVFSEGYSASFGDDLTRPDCATEAIRLARNLAELLPRSEVFGLLALMLLHNSRRVARTDQNGDIVLLEDQDRTRWDQDQIREGLDALSRAMRSDALNSYTIQAAIAAEHATVLSSGKTNWHKITQWYDLLLRADPSPIVELNRAVAIAMATSPEQGLQLLENLEQRGALNGYHHLHAAKADLFRRSGQRDAARESYSVALKHATQKPQQRFLKKRLAEIERISRGPTNEGKKR